MRKIYKLSSCAILLLGIGFTGVTYGGVSNLSATVDTVIHVSSVGDHTIASINPVTTGAGGVESNTATACVYSNATNNKYKVTATGNGAGNAFTLAGQGGIGGTLEYTVEWQDHGGSFSGITSGSGHSDQTGTNTVGCTNGHTASHKIKISQAAIHAATPGTYTGTLTFAVAQTD